MTIAFALGIVFLGSKMVVNAVATDAVLKSIDGTSLTNNGIPGEPGASPQGFKILNVTAPYSTKLITANEIDVGDNGVLVGLYSDINNIQPDIQANGIALVPGITKTFYVVTECEPSPPTNTAHHYYYEIRITRAMAPKDAPKDTPKDEPKNEPKNEPQGPPPPPPFQAPSLNFSSITGMSGVGFTITPFTDLGLLAKMKEYADNILAMLGWLGDEKGVQLVLIGGMNIKIDLPKDESAVFSFEAPNISHGKKVLALVADKDGNLSFAPVEWCPDTNMLTVRLDGGEYAVVFFEYLPAEAEYVNLAIAISLLRTIFDAEYYANRYPDLAAAFGNDADALFLHFIKYGLQEGRSADGEFDIHFYMIAYADLIESLGSDIVAFLKYYFQNPNDDRVTGVWQGIEQ
jgi:hypothetical protein